jgi:hypothetical protein
VNADTGQFNAITAERDQLRSDMGELASRVAAIGDAMVALGRDLQPRPDAAGGSGGRPSQGRRHAHLRAVR